MLARSRIIPLILATFILCVAVATPARPAYAADTEIAHIWRFTYLHAPGEGQLEVMVVEHDKETHEILNVLAAFTYAAPCAPSGGAITCELDIRSAIQDAYIQMDLKAEAAKVRPNESYRWMIVETTGRWNTIPAKTQSTIATHPSLRVVVATTAAKMVRFTSTWNTHTGQSNLFSPPTGQSLTLLNKFDCPSSPGSCTSTNALRIGDRVIALGSATSNATTVGFQLAPSQIQITPPPGFQLESFIIDPPKAGYG